MCVRGICREEAKPSGEGAGPLELGTEGLRPGVLGRAMCWNRTFKPRVTLDAASWLLVQVSQLPPFILGV